MLLSVELTLKNPPSFKVIVNGIFPLLYVNVPAMLRMGEENVPPVWAIDPLGAMVIMLEEIVPVVSAMLSPPFTVYGMPDNVPPLMAIDAIWCVPP